VKYLTPQPFRRSFVFLNVKIKKLKDVIDELIDFEEVKEVHVITGEKDLLVVIETQDRLPMQTEDIINVVINKIGRLKGVEKTDTIIPTRSRYKW
jgi:DNA-binding Lrp family transcriptional regulator